MEYKLIFTDQAFDSLSDISDFLLNDLELPQSKVVGIISQALDKAGMLPTNPFIGQREEYLDHTGLDHRRILRGNIKIIYPVHEQIIWVTDFFYVRRDPRRMKS